MKKSLFCRLLLILLTTFILSSHVYAQPDWEETYDDNEHTGSTYFSISAPSAILTEALRGQVLYEKNPDERLHISIASKIMTALLVTEQVNLNSPVVVSRESVESDGSLMFLEPGEKYMVRDLLYAIMLKSYNDAAKALAEFTAGSIEAFVAMMNKKAEELGLENTCFVNPTGLYSQGQYTTARDLARLVQHAIKNPYFDMIFSSKTVLWNGQEGPEILFNQNTLFWEYDGVDGGKTGFNEKDKHSSVTTATKSIRRLICVVLDTPEENVLDDSKNLLRYGYENYRIDKLVSANKVVSDTEVEGIHIDLISRDDVYYTHPLGNSFIASMEYNIREDIELPISRSQILGTVDFILEDGTNVSVSLFSPKEILDPESRFSQIMKTLLEYKEILYLLIILVALECLLIIANLLKLLKRVIKAVFSREKIKKHF